MTRTLLLVVIIALLAPVAAAAPALPDAPAAQSPVAHALQSAASGAASGASAIGHGAASAAGAIGSAVVAVSHAIGVAAIALGHALAASGAAIGRALGAAVAALGQLLTLLGIQLARGASWIRAHPVESANAAGAALSVAGLALWLKRFLAFGGAVGLYTRLAPGEILDNEARANVYAHIQANPGAHPSAIAETLGLGWGTIVYHLSKLEQGGLVTSRHAHAKKCYFAIDGRLDASERDAVAAMAGDKARDIVAAVRAAPGITQKELALALGMSQALASWHVKRLVASGVLRLQRTGRSNALTVADHVPLAAPVAA